MKYLKPQFLILSLILLFLIVSCKNNDPSFEIRLETRKYLNTPPFWGMSNIFFSKETDKNFIFPENCLNPEIASIVENKIVEPVYLMRYRLNDSLVYMVDTDADSDFKEEKTLVFNKSYKTIRIADVGIKTRLKDPGSRKVIKAVYQILYENQWVYARLAEYKEGTLRIKGKDYHIQLYSPSRDCPFYDKKSTIAVDLNNDGVFQRQSVLNGDTLILRETINPEYSFTVSASNFEISSIDPTGNNITLLSSDKRESISPGYDAPPFQATNILDGSLITLPDTGNIDLLEFWSVYCPNSGIAHNELMKIITPYKTKLKYIVIARENDPELVNKYFESNQLDADLIVTSEKGWQIYNEAIVTPCFYLIRNGKIIFSDIGYKSIPVLKEVLNRLNLLK